MNTDRTIWQIWAGPGSGAFAETFLRHGVALLGPEGPGPWRPDRRDEDYLDDQGRRCLDPAAGVGSEGG